MDQRTFVVARGQGLGEKLMRAMIDEAARRGLGLCLSVRSENPARRLYERLGLRDIPPVPLSRTALAACRSAWHEESSSDDRHGMGAHAVARSTAGGVGGAQQA